MKTNRRRVSPQPKPLTRAEFLRAPLWIKEHATRLHRQCKRVEAAQQNGKGVNEAFQHFSWYWREENFRSGPSKRVRFSPGTLRRIFYKWKSGGRSPESIALRFGACTKLKPTRLHQARYLKTVAAPGVLTMSAGYVKAGLPFKPDFFFRSLPATLRAPVRRLLYWKRHQRAEQRRFARALVQWERNAA